MSPGSALYFHGNTLHASDPNVSDRSRFSLIYGFVAASNIWVETKAKNITTRFEKLEDEELAAAMQRHWQRIQDAS